MLESSLLGVITALALWIQEPQAAPPGGDRGARPFETQASGFRLDYTARHALVIGIDKYEDAGFPKLSYAVADAKGVAELLVKQFGFKPENVTLLVNEQATKVQIGKALMEQLSNKQRVSDDDLVVLFFAGHGETQPVYRGKHGYLVPFDGRHDRKGTPEWNSLFGMAELKQASEAIPAKHALFLLDCVMPIPFALVPGRVGHRRARQVMLAGTSGGALEVGTDGHSIFTSALIDGMNGGADIDSDLVITVGELFSHVVRRAMANSEEQDRQHALIGNFPDDEGGCVAFKRWLPDLISAEQQTDDTSYWRAVAEAISENPIYQDLELKPQRGLVPLAADPRSNLWEFWVPATGKRPDRDGTSSRWKISDETGIVLVLLPGGTFMMGEPDSGSAHEVTVEPAFISKYEMTQGQWRRIAGINPSGYVDPKALRPLPVEQMSFDACQRVLATLGLQLPTEEQWEYAARAGTNTPWSTGGDKQALKAAANLADQDRKKYGEPESKTLEEWSDGYPVHAAVGRFAPNAFGLYDMHGNVWEWCRTEQAGDFVQVRRGGSFESLAADARCAHSVSENRNASRVDLGCRPARAIEQ